MRLREPGTIRCLTAATVILFATLTTTRPLVAQDWSAVGGALAGLGAGAWVGLGYVTVQARSGTFIESTGQAARVLAIPVLAGLGTGIALGVYEEDRLGDTALWATVGWVSGLGAGALIGGQLWDDPQRSWAGAVIGGAVGLLVGGIVGFVNSGEMDISVPAMVRIPL